MIDSKIIFNALKKNKVDFYSGVPDSLLKFFCSFVTDHTDSSHHIIAANEGAALSIGIGNYLATKKIPLIYMQNSGLGNAINPLTSLADKQVYSIPMILLIGWRGEPGVPDEPQHKKQGAVTIDILETLNIPYKVVSELTDTVTAERVIDQLCDQAQNGSEPVALVVSKNTFLPYDLKNKQTFSRPLTREEALDAVISDLLGTDIIISTTGVLSRELFELRDLKGQGHDRDFLTVGGMGHASQIALGIALEKSDRQVFCLDGDGSIIMHLGSLAISANSNAKNFNHIIFNNCAHDSVGGQPTVAEKIDILKISNGLGYKWNGSAKTISEIKEALKELRGIEGSCFLEIQVKAGFRSDLGRPNIKPIHNKSDFMSFLSDAK